MAKLSLLALTTLATSALTQNTTTTTPSNGTCVPPNYDVNAPVNASSVVPLNITSEPWYLTVALNDTRTNSSAETQLWGWLSTPANATGRACVYWLYELLPAQSSGTPNGQCAGSLSDKCVDFMKRSILSGAGSNCPNLPSREDLSDACGGPFANGYQSISTAGLLDPSNATCTDSRVPGTDQPPSTYINNALFGVTFGGPESSDASDPSKFTWYDKYIDQPTAWLILHAVDGGETETYVVCAAPRNVQSGSRKPASQGGEPSRAGRVAVNWLGLGVVGIAMAVL